MGRNNKAGNYDPLLYQSKIYKAWSNMRSRCYNKKTIGFHRYGGRGIKVCDQWRTFDGFLKDMESSYKDGMQLDRINNDGNYEPSNCRWADRKQQCRNRSSSYLITIGTKTKTLAEWVELSGLKPSTVRQRLYCYGWTIERCFKPLNIYEIG